MGCCFGRPGSSAAGLVVRALWVLTYTVAAVHHRNQSRPGVCDTSRPRARLIAEAAGVEARLTEFGEPDDGGKAVWYLGYLQPLFEVENGVHMLQFCCRKEWFQMPACWDAQTDFENYALCCFGELRRVAAEARGSEWLEEELRTDFGDAVFTANDLASRDEMEAKWGDVFCRFKILKGDGEDAVPVVSHCDPATVSVLRKGPGSEQYGQFKEMLKATRVLAANRLLPVGLDFFVSPSIYEFVAPPFPAPVLVKARAYFAGAGLIRVPSYELIGSFLDEVRLELPIVPWSERRPMLFWRGGMRSFNACPCRSEKGWPAKWTAGGETAFDSLILWHEQRGEILANLFEDETAHAVERAIRTAEPKMRLCRCVRRYINRSNLHHSNRFRLCELSKRFPALIDAKLAYIPRGGDYDLVRDELEARGYIKGSAREYVGFKEHLQHKYLISLDGSTIDDTRVYWNLASGSVLFKQLTPLLPYAIPALQPWVHFVPVREDLGDLVERVEWARAHDVECQAMAARAKEFADQYLTQNQVYHYIYRVLKALAEMQGLSMPSPSKAA